MADADDTIVTTSSTATPAETPAELYQRVYGQAAPIPVPAPPISLEPLTTSLEEMKAELQALRHAQAQPPVPAPAKGNIWVDKIREGKFDEAESAMAESLSARLRPQLDQARQEGYERAVQATQTTLEMDRYLQSIRQANPDIVQFERYLQAPVTERVTQAQAAGRIKNTTDFLREYRTAVDAEVATFRNVSQQFRAAGKDDANTRNQQVLHASPLTPQSVSSTQGTPSPASGTGDGESTEAYFQRRAAAIQRARGM